MAQSYDLTSSDNPRMKAVVKLREGRQRRKTGLFVAEGVREISRSLQCGLTLREGFWCPDRFRPTDEQAEQWQLHASRPRRWFTITPTLLSKVSYIENPEGVLAVFEQPQVTLGTLAARMREHADTPPLFLVAVGVTKPGNLGAMLRTAEAVGATGVLVSDGVVDLFNPNAIRASTGAVFTLPVVAATGEAIRRFLAEAGVKIIAADPAGVTEYHRVDMRQGVAIVIGAEDTGLDDAWRDAADVLVRIAMRSSVVDSLNASTAAAVMLFEAARQRGEEK